jgi:hypothetical protein
MRLSRFLAWLVLALVVYLGWSGFRAYKNPWHAPVITSSPGSSFFSSPVLRELPAMPDDCNKKGCAQ